MNTRSKLIAAILGLVVAAGAIGDASARTFAKRTHVVAASSTKIVVRKLHRPLIGTRVVKHVRFVHRAPVVGVKRIVRVTKRPLLTKQAFAHRVIVKKTVIR